MSDTAASDAAWKPKGNPWLIAVVVTMAAFMEILDTTIVNVSLPHIAGSVSASYDDATWTLTSYLLANGVVLTVSGFIGRLIGRKRYFLICIAMFTVCSFLCGTATSLSQLVVYRLFQGLFGGGLQPNQQSIILDTFPPAKRSQAFSVVAVAVIFAPAIGPTLGGWLTDNYSWRWVFLINIPVGLVAFFAVAALVEDPPWLKRTRARIGDTDWIGLGLIALGLGCLQVMLDRGEDDDWFSNPFIVKMGIMAAIGITGAVVWLTTTKSPIVRLTVFRDRNFTVGSIVIFAMGVVLYSGTVLLPQLAQEQLGYTATLAGLLLSPGALVLVVLVPIIGRIVLPRVQARYIIAIGFAGDRQFFRLFAFADARYQLRSVGFPADIPDRRARLPVRAEQHHHLRDPAEGAERRRQRAVCDVAQCGGIDRHLAGHRPGGAANPDAPRLSGRPSDAVRPAL